MSKYIDAESGIARVGGQKALYISMLKMFLTLKDLEPLDDFIKNNDIDETIRVVHTVKGVAGNLSLEMLFERSNEMLTKLREGSMPTSEEYDDYKNIIDETRKEILAYIG